MKEKLIEFIKENVSIEDINYTFSRMCIERTPLHYQNNNLYNQLSDLVDDFIADNELSEEWFEETFIDIEDLFEDLLDN